MVSGYKIFVFFSIINSESENSVHFIYKINTPFLIQSQNHFAIALCLKLIIRKLFAQLTMVINFSISSQNKFLVCSKQRLLNLSWFHFSQSFVRYYSFIIAVNTSAILTTMTYFFCYFKYLRP